jgi:hypothetical protein
MQCPFKLCTGSKGQGSPTWKQDNKTAIARDSYMSSRSILVQIKNPLPQTVAQGRPHCLQRLPMPKTVHTKPPTLNLKWAQNWQTEEGECCSANASNPKERRELKFKRSATTNYRIQTRTPWARLTARPLEETKGRVIRPAHTPAPGLLWRSSRTIQPVASIRPPASSCPFVPSPARHHRHRCQTLSTTNTSNLCNRFNNSEIDSKADKLNHPCASTFSQIHHANLLLMSHWRLRFMLASSKEKWPRYLLMLIGTKQLNFSFQYYTIGLFVSNNTQNLQHVRWLGAIRLVVGAPEIGVLNGYRSIDLIPFWLHKEARESF